MAVLIEKFLSYVFKGGGGGGGGGLKLIINIKKKKQKPSSGVEHKWDSQLTCSNPKRERDSRL